MSGGDDGAGAGGAKPSGLMMPGKRAATPSVLGASYATEHPPKKPRTEAGEATPEKPPMPPALAPLTEVQVSLTAPETEQTARAFL